MSRNCIWLTMSYTLQSEPSKLRVYTWRKLKDLGCAYLNQGVAVLPNTKENLDRFNELSDYIKSMNGEAIIAEMNFIHDAENEKMKEFFLTQTEREYKELVADCKSVMHELARMASNMKEMPSDKVRELSKKYRQLLSRNHLNNAPVAELEKNFSEMYDMFREMTTEFGLQFKKLMAKAYI